MCLFIFILCVFTFLFGISGDSKGALPNRTTCLSGLSEHSSQTAHSLKSYLFLCERIDELMVRAEQHVPQNWVPFAHLHILIQQCRLGNGVHQDLKETKIYVEY